MTYKSNFESVFCGVTFYNVLNIMAKYYSIIHVDLTLGTKTKWYNFPQTKNLIKIK
jgi:hypothetical protein